MTLETVSTEKQDFIKKFSSVCPTELKKQSRLTGSKSTKVDVYSRKSSNHNNILNHLLNRLPKFYETDSISLSGKLIYLHFFIFGSDWYISEYDVDDLFWGFVILGEDNINAEWGHISFQELRELNINGIEVDYDLHWKPVPAGEIDKITKCINSGCTAE
jgi:hypothetical protein